MTDMPVLFQIILGCLLGGLLSVAAAALVMFGLPRRWFGLIVSLAVGLMLSTALLKLMPEALEAGMPAHTAFPLLLGGIITFFMLERSMLWRHSHHHEHSQEQCVHDHHGKEAPLVVIGDSFHNFTDGVLIAAAFLADPTVGWSTTIAVLAHEVPQEAGDFAVLLAAGWARKRALFWNAFSSLMSVVGGLFGYFALNNAREWVPVALVIAAAGFLYIAVADLLPRLKRETRYPLAHALLLAAGIAMVALGGGHSHDVAQQQLQRRFQ